MRTLSQAKRLTKIMLRQQKRRRAAATARMGKELSQLNHHKDTLELLETTAQSNVESVTQSISEGMSSQNLKLVGRYVDLLRDGSDSMDGRIEQLTTVVNDLQKVYLKEKHREELLEERLGNLDQEHERLREEEDARTLESARGAGGNRESDPTSS